MRKSLIPLLLLLVMASCSGKKPQRQAANGIYYWRTTFSVSEYEQNFLRKHDVKRLYLHLFDVDIDKPNLSAESGPNPIATIQFRDTANLKMTMEMVDECIPTVFITLRALKAMTADQSIYCKKLTERIINMVTYHGFRDKVKEVQLDCDWTQTTEQMYFAFLREMRTLLREEGVELSVTVRLHQLRGAVPPVDRGVLMFYNTGALKNPKSKNSILSYEDVLPYLKNFQYSLPLDYAFPIYEWGVWFRNGKFQALLREPDYQNKEYYQTKDNVHYQVDSWHICEGKYLWIRDEIRREQSDFTTIERIKRLLPYRPGTSIILYHLDEKNLKNFNNYETKTLYNRPCIM